MRNYTIFFLSLLLFGLTSCSVEKSMTTDKIGVLYTNASQPDSAFVTFDENGQVNSQVNIPAMGIFQVIQGEKGDLLFPVQYDNKLYTLSPAKQLTKTTILSFPLYMTQVGDFRITTYNSSLNNGTVEWKNGKRTIRIPVIGFPRVATFDTRHVYVFSSIIEQKKPVLFVFDRVTGKMEKEITLEIDQANDLKIIDNNLLITSTASEKRIACMDLQTYHVNYLSLPDSQPEYILILSNNLLITYQGSPSLSILDRRSLHIVQQITLPQPVFKVKQSGDFLYVLSQIPNSGQGVIGIYRIADWKLTKKIMLPETRDTLVQDFIIF